MCEGELPCLGHAEKHPLTGFTLQHFIGNDQETYRGTENLTAESSNIDDRTLHEVYVRAFGRGHGVNADVAIACRLGLSPHRSTLESDQSCAREHRVFKTFLTAAHLGSLTATRK